MSIGTRIERFLEKRHRYVIAALVAAAAVVFLAAATAKAADATLTWSPPTQNVDNTPIPSTGQLALKQYIVLYGACNAAGDGIAGTPTQATVPAPASSATLTGFSYNTTVCFGVKAENNAGAQSALSAVVSKTWTAPAPKPPVILTVGGLVWELRNTVDGPRLARAVGTIKAGRQCQGLSPAYGDDLFVVRKADVKLKKDVKRGSSLVAICDAA